METIPDEKSGGNSAAGSIQAGSGLDQSPEGADALQEQEGLAIVLDNQAIVLSSLALQDFPLIRVILGGQPSSPSEYQAMAMAKLIQIIIGRTKLKPEQLEILRREPLKTYLAVSSAIERQLAILMS
jgi:hypothetical protein